MEVYRRPKQTSGRVSEASEATYWKHSMTVQTQHSLQDIFCFFESYLLVL